MTVEVTVVSSSGVEVVEVTTAPGVEILEVISAGPQGAQGIPGDVASGPSPQVGNRLSLIGDGLVVPSYTHTQALPATVWTINHNLADYPAVTVVDSSGSEVEGDVQHPSLNQTVLTFTAAFSGKARFI